MTQYRPLHSDSCSWNVKGGGTCNCDGYKRERYEHALAVTQKQHDDLQTQCDAAISRYDALVEGHNANCDEPWRLRAALAALAAPSWQAAVMRSQEHGNDAEVLAEVAEMSAIAARALEGKE